MPVLGKEEEVGALSHHSDGTARHGQVPTKYLNFFQPLQVESSRVESCYKHTKMKTKTTLARPFKATRAPALWVGAQLTTEKYTLLLFPLFILKIRKIFLLPRRQNLVFYFSSLCLSTVESWILVNGLIKEDLRSNLLVLSYYAPDAPNAPFA